MQIFVTPFGFFLAAVVVFFSLEFFVGNFGGFQGVRQHLIDVYVEHKCAVALIRVAIAIAIGLLPYDAGSLAEVGSLLLSSLSKVCLRNLFQWLSLLFEAYFVALSNKLSSFKRIFF